MSTTQAFRHSVVAPLLPAEAVAALPRRKPMELCALAGLVVGVSVLVLDFYAFTDWGGSPGSPGEALHQGLFFLAPWLLTLPWQRELDLRRVPWFFVCLFVFPFANAGLAGLFTYRALMAPYRTWRAAYWNVHRARALVGSSAWVLVSEADAGPAPMSEREAWWLRAEQIAWFAMIVLAVPLWIWRDSVEGTPNLGAAWGIAILALALAPAAVDLVLRTRRRFRRTRQTSSPL
ncbi:hypothetical protein EFK50_07410 [Nocardioides marmoriginsengisoli]|uniref:Uncharacterized protein n=1 Tax=Nocardioides marmoriginsengisoli TaxID=661483 RepID=A0A3N0CLL6_9ACTN|nr:hypothetical protein [Nocardioides marmoriginsengisoli]RNL64347.1 hypothetical protein EFK50_07410 [Nocardioides marmoriginsengisoli]